jgi:ubiquinone/menaquinone biosynthesis C-methylase UbiE
MSSDSTSAKSEHVARYVAAIEKQRTEDEFQAWFNRADDAEHAQSNGFWDFAVSIARPQVRFRLKRPHEKVALEIGCGGGRILGAASYYFRHVVGLDIHRQMDRVAAHLHGRRIENFTLLDGDGSTIPYPSASVDFVYSFIVLHHLQSFAAFESYVRESRRVLKPGGLALLYYGRREITRESDRYEPNEISLSVSNDDATHVAKSCGFAVIEEGSSWRFGEDRLNPGYQDYMLLEVGA